MVLVNDPKEDVGGGVAFVLRAETEEEAGFLRRWQGKADAPLWIGWGGVCVHFVPMVLSERAGVLTARCVSLGRAGRGPWGPED